MASPACPPPPVVLLVDDDPALRRSLQRLLERREQGLQVVLAPTLATGREALGHRRPDVLVTDLDLGDGSGLELLADAQDAEPSIPALLISGNVGPSEEADAFSLGARAVLHKPVPLDLLLRAVRGALALPGAVVPIDAPPPGSSALPEHYSALTVDRASGSKLDVVFGSQRTFGELLIATGAACLHHADDREMLVVGHDFTWVTRADEQHPALVRVAVFDAATPMARVLRGVRPFDDDVWKGWPA